MDALNVGRNECKRTPAVEQLSPEKEPSLWKESTLPNHHFLGALAVHCQGCR